MRIKDLAAITESTLSLSQHLAIGGVDASSDDKRITVQDMMDFIVAYIDDLTLTLTNKTIVASSNTISEIANANISATAAIDYTKLAALTTSRALQTNSSSGKIEVSSVTATQLAYLAVSSGTATASKAVVLNASKEINEITTNTYLYVKSCIAMTQTPESIDFTVTPVSNISIKHFETQLESETSGTDSMSMADGDYSGQLKLIVMVVDNGGNIAVTPSKLLNGTTITFGDVGDSILLEFRTGYGWMILSNNGCVIS